MLMLCYLKWRINVKAIILIRLPLPYCLSQLECVLVDNEMPLNMPIIAFSTVLFKHSILNSSCQVIHSICCRLFSNIFHCLQQTNSFAVMYNLRVDAFCHRSRQVNYPANAPCHLKQCFHFQLVQVKTAQYY